MQQNNLDKKVSAYIGISMVNKFYSNKNLREILIWAKNNCDRFMILLGDEIQKYNFMAFGDVPEAEATKKAISMGDWKLKEINSLIKNIGLEKIEVIRWEQVKSNKEFLRIKTIIYNYFYKDSKFREDVLTKMRLSIPNKIEAIRKAKGNEAVITAESIACNYVLEEISCFLFISEFYNYSTRISKEKQLLIIEKVYNKEYLELWQNLKLKNIIQHIQIDIKQHGN